MWADEVQSVLGGDDAERVDSDDLALRVEVCEAAQQEHEPPRLIGQVYPVEATVEAGEGVNKSKLCGAARYAGLHLDVVRQRDGTRRGYNALDLAVCTAVWTHCLTEYRQHA